MLKSPEEYLSSLDFDSGDHPAAKPELSAGERAFVEKYLGLAALEEIPETEPETVPLPPPAPAPMLQTLPPPAPIRSYLPPAAPQIIVAPPSVAVEIAPSAPADAGSLPVQDIAPVAELAETAIIAETAAAEQTEAAVAEEVAVETAVQDIAPVAELAETAIIAETAAAEQTEAAVAEEVAVGTAVQDIAPVAELAETAVIAETAAAEQTEAAVAEEVAVSAEVETTAVQTVPVEAKKAVSADVLLKEKLRQEAEVQLVSFFVSGQIFLLPVEGIQEVLRHMELIKVPQAPDFVAGVINLRGHVTPVVYLSALLTNGEVRPYDESNFIIVTGTEKLQLGLIIDKVSSMHLVPQKDFIWNPESKLADAAEFLNAIVTLDDRVCGMVAPEAITRLILPEAL